MFKDPSNIFSGSDERHVRMDLLLISGRRIRVTVLETELRGRIRRQYSFVQHKWVHVAELTGEGYVTNDKDANPAAYKVNGPVSKNSFRLVLDAETGAVLAFEGQGILTEVLPNENSLYNRINDAYGSFLGEPDRYGRIVGEESSFACVEEN